VIMDNKISDLTVNELKSLITKTVQEAIENYIEDLKALSSKDFVNSIKEAREDYKAGDFKDSKEVF